MTDIPKLTRNRVIARGSGRRPPDASDTFFLAEVEIQAAYGDASYGEMLKHISNGSKDKMLLGLAHMALVFSGNVAKILFPNPSASTSRKERALRLRQVLNVTEASPITDREARNFVEHFDERMEQFLEQANAG